MKPFVELTNLDKIINDFIVSNSFEEACELLAKVTLSVAHDQKFLGGIYSKNADVACIALAKSIFSLNNFKSDYFGEKKVPFIIATEMYEDGGHSRIIEDFIRIYPNAEVILTGYYPLSFKPNYRLCRGINGIDSLQLPLDTAVNNILRLHRIINNKASMVFHVAHHHDVVANAALVGINSIPIFFIHHSDHRPSLGATIKNFIHVDIAQHVAEICKRHLGAHCISWQQGVYDYGKKLFDYPLKKIITATSGSAHKFSYDNDISLPKIISSLLKNGAVEHLHIGYLNDAQLNIINNELKNQFIDLRRFNYLSSVPSLWKHLKYSEVNVFIGSGPIHGLRTAIEVQGVGLPILPFRQVDGSLLNDSTHYACEHKFWTSPNDFSYLLPWCIENHTALAFASRLHYKNKFSLENMKNSIEFSVSNFKNINF